MVDFTKVPPLDWQTPIVDPKTGQPSAQFIRLWQQTFQNQEAVDEDVGDFETRIDQLEDDVVDIETDITALDADKAEKSVTITAGVGLSGGGDLSINRTIDLENTAVTPNTYGDGTNIPQITIDQQGRVTFATEVPVTGGGGGGKTLLAAWDGSIDPPTSTIVVPLTGISTLEVYATAVTKAAAGWIGGDFSYDGGATWPLVTNYQNTGGWPTTGVIPAPALPYDTRWYLHATAATAARSIYGRFENLNRVGYKPFISTRNTPAHIYLNQNIPTHFRVAAILDSAGANTTFTGGKIEIWGVP